MPRYVDAEQRPRGDFWESLSDKEKCGVLGFLLSLPTADVEAIRYGEWLPKVKETLIPVELDEFGAPAIHKYTYYVCSLCGRQTGIREPYCHCGAKMFLETTR